MSVESAILSLARESEEFWVPSRGLQRIRVPSVHDCEALLEFQRKYVSRNVPVVIEDAIDHWPALSKWTPEHLKEKLKDTEVTVAITPDGKGDCIIDGKFVLPLEKQMKFNEAMDEMMDKSSKRVLYMQTQNDCLSKEFPSLVEDVEVQLDWANKILGSHPDAVNLWIGDSRSISSMHKDPYENFYAVITGSKEFLLHPPTDYPFLYEKEYPQANFIEEGDKLLIKEFTELPPVSWISVDPDNPSEQSEQFPLYRHSTPIRVTLNPGEMLYLPSFWFHQVTQTDMTIAVNLWYDMDFAQRFCWFQYHKEISALLHSQRLEIGDRISENHL